MRLDRRGSRSRHPRDCSEEMPLRATRYTGARFDGVGKDRPKASDHCPVVIEVTV